MCQLLTIDTLTTGVGELCNIAAGIKFTPRGMVIGIGEQLPEVLLGIDIACVLPRRIRHPGQVLIRIKCAA